jgi:hypothetical protein
MGRTRTAGERGGEAPGLGAGRGAATLGLGAGGAWPGRWAAGGARSGQPGRWRHSAGRGRGSCGGSGTPSAGRARVVAGRRGCAWVGNGEEEETGEEKEKKRVGSTTFLNIWCYTQISWVPIYDLSKLLPSFRNIKYFNFVMYLDII